VQRFKLVTHRHLDVPIEPVWEALHAVDDWQVATTRPWMNTLAPLLAS
jgi:uncharacterized protein YndB with AHSA1/START domain